MLFWNSEQSFGAKRKVSSEVDFRCQLPREIPVNDFKVGVTKPEFDGQSLADDEGSFTLGTIIDGSTTNELGLGSEVIVYLEHDMPKGFTVSFAPYILKVTFTGNSRLLYNSQQRLWHWKAMLTSPCVIFFIIQVM